MDSIQIGPSDLRSSRLAYGCWRLPGSGEFGATDQDKKDLGIKTILAAFEAGFTLFDHADVYGHGAAESIFGDALRKAPGMRDSILLATKCGIQKASPENSRLPYRYDFSYTHIISSCEASLKRLQTDRIDLYQLHRPDYLMDPEEVAKAFQMLKDSGKVRYFGVSNFTASKFTLLNQALGSSLISHQIEISLGNLTRFDDGTLDQCQLLGVTPLAWSPLDRGRLATSACIEMDWPDHAHRLKVRESLDLLAREKGLPRSVIALSWLLRHPSGIIPIVGSTNPSHLAEMSKASSSLLNREEWYWLMEAAHGSRLP